MIKIPEETGKKLVDCFIGIISIHTDFFHYSIEKSVNNFTHTIPKTVKKTNGLPVMAAT